MTDLDSDAIEQARMVYVVAFGELIKNGIVPRGDAEQLLRQAIEAHATAGPGNQAAAKLLTVVLQSLSEFQSPTRQ
jgi:hypothetical protein